MNRSRLRRRQSQIRWDKAGSMRRVLNARALSCVKNRPATVPPVIPVGMCQSAGIIRRAGTLAVTKGAPIQ